MSDSIKQDEFVDGLREQWLEQLRQEGQSPSYVFNGWSGTDYSHWLEHRHGWPVDRHGNCRVSREEDPIAYTDCSVCSVIVAQFEARQQ